MIVWNIGKVLLISCLIIEIRCTGSLEKTFSCKDGGYIAKEHFCDGGFDCDDESDEPPFCNEAQEFCGASGLFRCPDTTKGCIDADLISDTEVYAKLYLNQPKWNINSNASFADSKDMKKNISLECNDKRCVIKQLYMPEEVHWCFYNFSVNSSSISEQNELEENMKNYCSSHEDTFTCEDGKRCLKLEYVCDGYYNCINGSDEKEKCSEVDHKKLFNCPHGYFPTPLGPRCMDTSLDNDCTRDEFCDQECFRYKNTSKVMCSCHNSYTRLTDMQNNFRCQHTDFHQDVIIYATSTQLKYMNLTTKKSQVLQNSTEITALTATSDHLYYAMYSNKKAKIVKYSFSLRSKTEVELHSHNLDSPITSMAVDHTEKNVYFIENSTSILYNASNSSCTAISPGNVNRVVLAPNYGLMFYSSYTKKNDEPSIWSIIKYKMSVSENVTLIEKTHSPVKFLAIDESIKRLYWLETSGTLFSVPFNGDTSEIRKYEHLKNVESITAHDSRVFYTKSDDGKIYTLQNRQHFTKSIGKSYDDRFNVFGYLKESDEQLNVGHFITANHLHACRYKVLFDHPNDTIIANSSTTATTNSTPSTASTTENTTKSTTAVSSESSTEHSPKEEEQKGEPTSGSSFWPIFSVIIILIVAAFGLYVWYNRRRHPYTNFNARTWFRSNFNHTNDYDQNEF